MICHRSLTFRHAYRDFGLSGCHVRKKTNQTTAIATGQTQDQNITHGRAALGSASLDRGFYNRLTLAILSPMKSKEATACGYPAECRRAPFAALYASVR